MTSCVWSCVATHDATMGLVISQMEAILSQPLKGNHSPFGCSRAIYQSVVIPKRWLMALVTQPNVYSCSTRLENYAPARCPPSTKIWVISTKMLGRKPAWVRVSPWTSHGMPCVRHQAWDNQKAIPVPGRWNLCKVSSMCLQYLKMICNANSRFVQISKGGCGSAGLLQKEALLTCWVCSFPHWADAKFHVCKTDVLRPINPN